MGRTAIVIAACAAVAAAAGCKDKLAGQTLIEQKLPGFVLGMPEGKYLADERRAYDTGKVMLELRTRDGRAMLGVSWSAGGVLGDEETEKLMAEGLARGIVRKDVNARLRGSQVLPVEGGLPTKTFEIGGGDATMFLTVIECGRRAITIVHVGGGGDHLTFHKRVVASFRCTPDPAREAEAPGPPPIAFAADGWTAGEATSDTVSWARDGASLSVTWSQQANPEHLPVLLESIFTAQGGTADIDRVGDAGGRPLWEGEASVDGERGVVVATLVPCKGKHALAMYIGPGVAEGRDVLARATCEP